MKIYSPNKEYTGVSASVPFCSGMGETDDPYLIEWFKSHGYRVETDSTEETDIKEPVNEEPAEEVPVKPVKKKAGQ
jgi:hypothetical protein